MLKAKHTFLTTNFIKYFSLWNIEKTFHSVNISNKLVDKKLPLMIIANHFSWWDGFWINYLNSKVFNRKFYFMMLEDQLLKRKFLLNTGGFSVNKSSRSIVETIQYTSELLKNNQNMVLIFPQGKIQSLYNQKFVFEKGVEAILKRTDNEIQIVFVANLIDYYSHEKPSLFMYIEEMKGEDYSIENIEYLYNLFFKSCADNNKSGELV